MRPDACGSQQQEATRPSMRDLVRSCQELGPRGEGALLAAVEGGCHVGRDVATYRLALATVGGEATLAMLRRHGLWRREQLIVALISARLGLRHPLHPEWDSRPAPALALVVLGNATFSVEARLETELRRRLVAGRTRFGMVTAPEHKQTFQLGDVELVFVPTPPATDCQDRPSDGPMGSLVPRSRSLGLVLVRVDACGARRWGASATPANEPSAGYSVEYALTAHPTDSGATLAILWGGTGAVALGRIEARSATGLMDDAIGTRCVLLPLAECSGIGPRVELAFEDGVAVVRDWAYVGAPSSVRAAIEAAVGPHPRSGTHDTNNDPLASQGPLTTDQRRRADAKPIGRCCPQCDVWPSAALMTRRPTALPLCQGGMG